MSLLQKTQSITIKAFKAPARRSNLTLSLSLRSFSTTKVRAQEDKISVLVDQISTLNLLETSALITQLKTRLNISAVQVQQAVPATPAPEKAPEIAVKEKTSFTIKLESFDAASKAKVIREMKQLIPNATLVEAKKFVETCPKVVRENVPKEEADKIKAALEAIGAVVVLE